MTQPDNPIRIDPFFDGEGGPAAGPMLPGYEGQQQPAGMAGNQVGATRAAASHAQGYHDVANEYTLSGRPMGAVMRGGDASMRGTIIPRSTMGGVPAGTQPHLTSQVQVNIDPHLEGQSAQVTLGEITESSIRNAEAMADDAGIPPAYDIATLRMRGAAVMQGIAAQSHAPVQDQQPAAVTAPQVANIESPRLGGVANGHAAQSPVRRQVRPLQAFNQTPQTHDPATGREMRAIDLSASPNGGLGGRPPSKRVTFEIEHFGMHHANYHEVLIESGFLVLIFDRSFPGGEMYVPPAGDNAPEMALHIEGTDVVYLVHTTGLHYSYGDHEFCILMIGQVGDAAQVADEEYAV